MEFIFIPFVNPDGYEVLICKIHMYVCMYLYMYVICTRLCLWSWKELHTIVVYYKYKSTPHRNGKLPRMYNSLDTTYLHTYVIIYNFEYNYCIHIQYSYNNHVSVYMDNRSSVEKKQESK